MYFKYFGKLLIIFVEDEILRKNEELKVPEENENGTDSSSDSEEEGSKFPNTEIKIQHFAGTKFNNIITVSSPNVESEPIQEDVIYLGDDKPVILKSNENTRSRGNSESKNKKPPPKGS